MNQSRHSAAPQSRTLQLSVFDFVPDEQVLAPFGSRLGVVAEQHVFEPDAQRLLRSEKRHARLFGRAAALARVARDAGRREVFGRRAPRLRARRDVVERQLVRRTPLPAVLAAELVAHEDAQSPHASGLSVAADVDVSAQADDARHAELRARRAQDAPRVELLDKYSAPYDEAHGPRDSQRAERLV